MFWQIAPGFFWIEPPALACLLPARTASPLIGGGLRERFHLPDMSLLHNHLRALDYSHQPFDTRGD